MKIHIIAIGKLGRGPLADLIDDYRKRITWPLIIHELIPKKMPHSDQQKNDDAKRIRAAVPMGAILIVLDERGHNISSNALATNIAAYQNSGSSQICFVIGGADGLAPTLGTEAHHIIAFGQATWPHMMMRLLLLEQIYRAQKILENHPYHRV